ncbi:MAG: hypothetical protein J6V28_00435 [Tidjanibacter sp.]|nr:hypothetical protein [Tidjanibacter sp.]
MKKLFVSMFAIAAAVFATSCTNEVLPESFLGDEAVVSFTVNTPEVATRAEFGDGTKANDLYYAVYLRNTKTGADEIVEISRINKNNPDRIEIETTVEFKLVNGNTYSFLFWAENGENTATYIDWESKTMNFNPAKANVEGYDAFYAYVEPFKVTGRITDEIDLYRPFAQVNVGTADYEDAKAAGTTIVNAGIEIDAYTTLNFVSGAVSNPVTAVYEPTALPADSEKFPVAGYKYLSMNYVLVGADKHLVNVKFNYNDGENKYADGYQREYANVPVRRNYRTNIYGDIITDAANYTITIKPGFLEEPGYEVNTWDGGEVTEPAVDAAANTITVSTASELAWVAASVNEGNTYKGWTIELANDINLDGFNWTPIGYWTTFEGVFDGKGYSIYDLKHHGTEADCYIGLFGCTKNATIKNVTIKDVDIKLVGDNSWAGGHAGALVGYPDGTTVIENVTVSGLVKIEGDYAKKGAQRIGAVVGGFECVAITLNNVKVDAEEGSYVKGNLYIGGVAGAPLGTMVMTNVESNIDVFAQDGVVGGIVGFATIGAEFTNCSSSGNVTRIETKATATENQYMRIGGIAGSWSTLLTLTGCEYTGTLSAKDNAGNAITNFDNFGLVGRSNSKDGVATPGKLIIDGVEY